MNELGYPRAVASTLPLALTMGDPAGIGLELALKAWRARKTLPAPFLLLTDANCLRAAQTLFADDVPLIESDFAHAAQDFDRGLPFMALNNKADVTSGKPNPSAAPAILESITTAVKAVRDGLASSVVTNPIAKSVLYEAGFGFPGHTEFLGKLAADFYGAPDEPFLPVMLLWSETLATVPVTVHIALKDVPQQLTQALIERVAKIVARDCQRWFGIAVPRLAVAGLNPHAGEDGAMGLEERHIITPAIKALQAAGLQVTGPYPADTLFHARARQHYDVVLAMYHDQALIPIKTLAFDEAVNVTLGLPFLRTSPDHGTAFDIAGRNIARADSLLAALTLAGRLTSQAAKRKEAYAAP